ncbi:hypothetical protein WJX84_007875 [Apatococcus fuscideae]|uniref:Uncharacterized protein n=1 Tax=Apatococcus fuscideae TaxID=2026836 RepID=A0AAW1RJE0_9CHLO
MWRLCAPLALSLLFIAHAKAQCLAPTQAALCGAANSFVSIGVLGVDAADLCTTNVGAGVSLPLLPLPTTTNGAIAVSVVNPIVSAKLLPFVGTWTVTYPASPLPGCPGNDGLLGLGATVVTCTTTCDAANQGTVQGEPHFVGFDGSRYDFQVLVVAPSEPADAKLLE